MNNLISFSRFTNLNPNIAQHGATAEELIRARGTPDANPVLSPMPSPAVPEARLALSRLGSDQLRLGRPSSPAQNPYEGPKRTVSLSRTAVTKLKGRVLTDLRALVKEGAIGAPEVRDRMDDSMLRVLALTDKIGHVNVMTDAVEANLLSVSHA